MFRWSKNTKSPAPAGAAGEVAVQKVDKIEFVNLVKPPPAPADGSNDDINDKAGRFIQKTRWGWSHS